MTTIELHSTFVWDCDNCGRENFLRAMQGNLEDAAFDAIVSGHCEDSGIVTSFDAEEPESLEVGASLPFVISRVNLYPRKVTCPHCKANYESTVLIDEDEP